MMKLTLVVALFALAGCSRSDVHATENGGPTGPAAAVVPASHEGGDCCADKAAKPEADCCSAKPAGAKGEAGCCGACGAGAPTSKPAVDKP